MLGSVCCRDITLPAKGHILKAMAFPGSHVWMWELDNQKGWAPKNWCHKNVVLQKTWGSLGQQGDQTSQSYRKSTLNINWQDWCWNWSSNTLATWCKELTHWKRPWCWQRLKAGREGDDTRWDDWKATPTQWTWVEANARK